MRLIKWSMQADEPFLIRAAQRGEFSAATELVDRYYPAIYAFLRRLTRNDDEAADLTQRTFMKVWEALRRFAGRSSFRSWLHAIAFHIYQDWRRKNHRFESPPDPWWTEIVDHRSGPDQQAIANDTASRLYAAVDRLKPDLRSAVCLHYYQGLTLDETAEVLGIATSTVKYRLRIALEELQKQLDDDLVPSPRLNPIPRT